MKKADVEIGGRYIANVSGKRCIIRITDVHRDYYGDPKGWDAVNENTGREIRVLSAQRLLRKATPEIAAVYERLSRCSTLERQTEDGYDAAYGQPQSWDAARKPR